MSKPWGELRSALHERRGWEALLEVLYTWAPQPHEDASLQRYLLDHRDAWMWAQGTLPPVCLLERWMRGELLFLLGAPRARDVWGEQKPDRLLDIALEDSIVEREPWIAFRWSIATTQELTPPLAWLASGSRQALQDASAKDTNTEESVATLEELAASGMFDLEDTNDQPWVDLSLFEWTLGEEWPSFPLLDVELTTEGLSVWFTFAAQPTPAHWIALLELGWQMDQFMPDALSLHLYNWSDFGDTCLQEAMVFYRHLRAWALPE